MPYFLINLTVNYGWGSLLFVVEEWGHTLKMLQISMEEAHFLEQNGGQKFVFRWDLNAIK